jgi:hypothetical protein
MLLMQEVHTYAHETALLRDTTNTPKSKVLNPTARKPGIEYTRLRTFSTGSGPKLLPEEAHLSKPCRDARQLDDTRGKRLLQ